MSDFIKACTLSDIQEDTGICVLVEGKQVALFRPRNNDTIYALGNFDPIGKANVLSRGLISEVKSKMTVASPLYKQHYCLDDGVCLEDDTVRVETYEVSVKDNDILVRV